jgi:1-aminocyclopropane-1-carboxylate deaminase/D-cysteine desulfhydrase-like pyridoxal-dependent ACC family enzyme
MIHSTVLPDINKPNIQKLEDHLFLRQKIEVDVLRLDKIHTIISGNKWFKLKNYLFEAESWGKKGVITFGGAYSNYLLATAYSCKLSGLRSIGIVRGEEPAIYSSTLLDLKSYGMELKFYPREIFKDHDLKINLQETYPDFLLVEEGGRGLPGIKGAEEILQVYDTRLYSHIICAVGTGTMITGMINASISHQQVIGIPVLKIKNLQDAEISEYIKDHSRSENFYLQPDFHFGGYAKKNAELIHFMNRFYTKHQIPTDFVYTGKLFYGTIKMIEQGFFVTGSKLLVIHSGGLQGNRSLPEGTFHFSF